MTTDLIGTNVVFSWIAPSSRGDAITSYNVYIESKQTLSFILSSQYCNSIASLSCSIPMSVLSNPSGDYRLNLGTLIRAKLTATNSMGESIPSAPNTVGISV